MDLGDTDRQRISVLEAEARRLDLRFDKLHHELREETRREVREELVRRNQALVLKILAIATVILWNAVVILVGWRR